MRCLKFPRGPSFAEIRTPCPPQSMAGMALFVWCCICVFSACSESPESLTGVSSSQNATPLISPTPEIAPTTVPAAEPPVPAPITSTPVPSITPSASTIILQLTIATAETSIPYNRDDWKHWIDADKDCQDARHEVLISESTLAVEFEDSRKCRVATGRWTDPYTGRPSTNPRDLHIVHMVPLANAHKSGGHAWDKKRKTDYANYLSYAGHLIAVSVSTNRSKGGKGPEEWRPPNTSYWCQYALDWIAVKQDWKLTATEAETEALSEMLDTCDTRIYIQATHRKDTTPTPTTTPAPTELPAPTPTPTPILTPESKPIENRNCSDFDTWSAAQAFFEEQGGPDSDPHRLDRDGDGIACQSLPGAPSIETSTPKPTPILTPESKPIENRNCSDFDTWSAAQAFFESEGGPDSDPHRLDRDGDGIPCQSLPGAPSNAATPASTDEHTHIQDPNCSDFRIWDEAQAFFLANGGSESVQRRLDADGNGIPCQSIMGAPNMPTLLELPIQDKDCSDFDTWSEAQAFFEEQGGPNSDPHRLDRDGDGIPCQSLRDASDAPTPITTEDTHNCSDFNTWSEAQAFFESEGGPDSDPHRLDRDGDGIACQSLRDASKAPTPTSANTPRTASRDTRNCSDFDTWPEAQAFFEEQGGPGSDPHKLDRDGDGIACQSLPGAPDTSEASHSPDATPTHTPTPTPKQSDTHNCSDFDTWSEAQAFFESEGGPGSDPHRLDRDKDGIACQSLPGAPQKPTPTPDQTSTHTPTPTPKQSDTHNCSDFDTWSEAQAFFESEGGPNSDPHRLDRDKDGIACQSLPGAPQKPTPTPDQTSTHTPTPTPKQSDTHNCSDFDTWSEAQAFFESEGGPNSDPHRLDRDKDGVACQSLPGAPQKPTPTPDQTSTHTPTPTPKQSDTHNCSDFDTWSEAQAFFESEGGPNSDPHRLDRDKDGVACQSLPGAPQKPTPTPDQTSTHTPTPTPKQSDTHNCSDFDTWSEAQAFFESEGGPNSDPHRLDRDKDGTACQSLPGAPQKPTPTPDQTPTHTPTPTPKQSDTHNCSDFDTWSEAQAFFESEGGPNSDPHRLDRDKDGTACQSLPGAPQKPTPTPDQTPTHTPTPTPKQSDTHNCSDFDTWSEAQAFFESEGGPNSDPHRLDRDKDGVACQSLPGAPQKPTPTPDQTSTHTPTPTPKQSDTHNCSDFDTWSEAQAFFESEGGPNSDPHRLDRDKDGVACQSLPGAP